MLPVIPSGIRVDCQFDYVLVFYQMISFSLKLGIRLLTKLEFPFSFLVELDCGGKTSENITHFTKSVGEAAALTGKCDADVCRVTENICQLRLDFTSFVLAGPSTNTQTTHFTSFGEPVSSGTPNRIAQTSIGKLVSLILFKLSIDYQYLHTNERHS